MQITRRRLDVKGYLLTRQLNICCAGLVAAELPFLTPSPVPDNLDFGQLYRSIVRAFEGRELYQLSPELIESNSDTGDLRGEIPFPGPPWYVALLLPLGFLSALRAALVWALINIALVCCTVALVVARSTPVCLGVLSLVALLSAPVQGHIVVGQFTIIAGFGFALVVWGTRRGFPFAMALGLVTATFKPHFGVPFMLVGLTAIGQESFKMFLVVLSWCAGLFVALTLLALLIDPTSITSYMPYLQKLNSLTVNKVCDTCSSIPIVILRPWQNELEQLWTARFILSAICWLALVIPLFLCQAPRAVVLTGAMFVTLLAAPYARNYDYVLLVTPLILTWQEGIRRLTGRNLHLVYGLLLCAAALAGIGPYMTDRTQQSSYLWLAPAMGYLSSLIVLRSARNRP